MEKNKKVLFVLGVVVFLLIVSLSVFAYYRSRVHWKYDDKWIIGKTKEEVVERYGEFGWSYNENTYGYLVYEDGKSFMGLPGSGNEQYYLIVFDDDDIATEVYVLWRPGG